MSTRVDLSQLAYERDTSAPPRRRRLASRYGVPLTLLVAFAAVVIWSARASLLPARRVTVTPVLVAKAEIQSAGEPLFQAAGWIEPRPSPVLVSAMVEGVVEKLLVIEGQTVARDQPIAELVKADAELSLKDAAAVADLRRGELKAAKAAMQAAETVLAQPVHLDAALADADGALAKLTSERQDLPHLVRVAEARLRLAEQDVAGKRPAAESLAGRMLQKAESELQAATSALAELRQRGPNLDAQWQAASRKRAALAKQRDALTDERLRLADAEANVMTAESRLRQAEVAVDTARLRLKRMTIAAPIDGRVLALHVSPGTRLAGTHDSSTVVSLYDPRQLQLRVDVRLEDVRRVELDQPVTITTSATADTLHGRVIAVTSQADVQKNTLEVKVAIDEPSPLLKPSMLAQAVFLAPPRTESTEKDKERLRVLVPRELVRQGDGGPSVWIADLSEKVARQRTIRLGHAGDDKLVEVIEGLNTLDKLIVSPREDLCDGERIEVSGEDPNLGTLGRR